MNDSSSILLPDAKLIVEMMGDPLTKKQQIYDRDRTIAGSIWF